MESFTLHNDETEEVLDNVRTDDSTLICEFFKTAASLSHISVEKWDGGKFLGRMRADELLAMGCSTVSFPME